MCRSMALRRKSSRSRRNQFRPCRGRPSLARRAACNFRAARCFVHTSFALEVMMPALFGKQYTRQELLRRVGHLSQIGGVQLLANEDGPARGVRLLEFRTGT